MTHEAIAGDAREIEERFYRDLEFGTAGLRGILGAGTNRMNLYMVRKATQGLANYLNAQGGKKAVATEALQVIMENAGALPANAIGEHFSEGVRLVPRRSFSLIVDDEQVELAVRTIIKVNQTGQPGDGRIFVMPVGEGYNIRTGQRQLQENGLEG